VPLLAARPLGPALEVDPESLHQRRQIGELVGAHERFETGSDLLLNVVEESPPEGPVFCHQTSLPTLPGAMSRALAIDLDGTLLGPDHTVSAANRQALDAARAAGFSVIIATARWYQLAQEVAAELGGVDGPAIACSGAEVRRLSDGTDLFDVRLPPEFATRLYEMCDGLRCIVWAVLDDSVLLKLDGDPAGLPPEMHHVRRLTGAADVPPRIVLLQGSSATKAVVEELAGEWSDRVRFVESISSDDKSILTLTSTGADKGVALAVACRDIGIEPSGVVAIGDAENDIEMFRVAGMSFAMGQANEIVKRAATHVTAPNSEDGVARAVEQVLAAL
jgi:Cof subfamily protein (haloacid dehalogenase superfamily)